MKYIVPVQSSLMVDAETPEEAAQEVSYAFEDARTRNCGSIDDEILAGARITETGIKIFNEE